MGVIGVPKGIADPVLYQGLEDVLWPLTFDQLIVSALFQSTEAEHGSLVSLARSFGESDETVEKALARLVEIDAVFLDRYGSIQLGTRYRDIYRRQLSSLGRRVGVWNGTWLCVSPTDPTAGLREDVQEIIRLDKFREHTAGAWIRPNNLAVTRDDLRALQSPGWKLTDDVTFATPRSIATELWDAAGWRDDASALLDVLEGLQADDGYDVSEQNLPRVLIIGIALFKHLAANSQLPPALAGESRVVAKFHARLLNFRAAIRPVVQDVHGLQFSPDDFA